MAVINLDASTQEVSTIIGTGLKVGQMVSISMSGFDVTGAETAVKFFSSTDPTIPSSFTFDLQPQNNKILRWNEKVPASEQDWGEWPMHNVSEAVTLTFEVGTDAWLVHMNGQTTPWFDFPRDHQQIVRVVAQSGLKDAQIAVDRVNCAERVCHPGECTECWFDFQIVQPHHCSVLNAGDTCTPATGHLESCCKGAPHTLDWTDTMQGTWVSTLDDADTMTRTCQAFASENADMELCGQLAGQVGRVLAKHGGEMFELWFPSMLPELKPIYMPSFALWKQTPQWRKFTINHTLPPGLNFGSSWTDDEGLMIRSTEGQAADLGIPVNWFINTVADKPGTAYFLEWYTKSGEDFEITLSNMPEPQKTCTDVPNWEDSDGDRCEKYVSKTWCRADGTTTPTWKGRRRWWWLLKRGYDIADRAKNGVSARFACCQCGGGTREVKTLSAPLPTIPPTTTTITTTVTTTMTTLGPALTPRPGLPTEVYVRGGEEFHPLLMGLYVLDTSLLTHVDGIRAGIYENTHGKYLYYHTEQQKWMIGKSFREVNPEAFTVSPGDEDVLWMDGVQIPFRMRMNNGEWNQVVLRFGGGFLCEYDTCACPVGDFECKVGLNESNCVGDSCVEETCCVALEYCSQFSQDYCGITFALNSSQRCVQTGCDQTQCCDPLCLDFKDQCTEDRPFQNSAANKICPGSSCTIDFCCKKPETTTLPPITTTKLTTTTTGLPPLVVCNDCTSSENEEQAISFNLTMEQISIVKLFSNSQVRTDFEDTIRLATAGVSNSAFTVRDVFIENLADTNTTRVFVVPPETDDILELRAMLRASSMIQDIEAALNNIQDVQSVMYSGETTVVFKRASLIEYVYVITRQRLGQNIEGRTWTQVTMQQFRGWTEAIVNGIVRFWYIVVGVLVILGTGLFWFIMWVNHDNRDQQEVLG